MFILIFVQKSNKRGVKKICSAFFVATNITKLCYFELVKKKFGLSYKELTIYLKNCHYVLKNIGLGYEIRDPEKTIPDPGSRVKKAPNPATLTV
jgi:hypothetical protein